MGGGAAGLIFMSSTLVFKYTVDCLHRMGTNHGWPEAFGFSIIGNAPVMVSDVEESGSAQQAGLQIGDFIVELDGETVEQWSKEEVKSLRNYKGSSLMLYSTLQILSVSIHLI